MKLIPSKNFIFRIKKGSRRDSTSSTDAEESEQSSDASVHDSDDEPLVAQVDNLQYANLDGMSSVNERRIAEAGASH